MRCAPRDLQSSRSSASCVSRAWGSLHAPSGPGRARPASPPGPSQTLWSRIRSAISPGPSTPSPGSSRGLLRASTGDRPSIGSVGDAFDNALIESVNGLFKAECIRTTVFHPGPFRTRRRRRDRNRRLGRLVQQPPPPWLPRDARPSRVRDAPLRGLHPRARTRKVAAENLGRFSGATGSSPRARGALRCLAVQWS